MIVKILEDNTVVPVLVEIQDEDFFIASNPLGNFKKVGGLPSSKHNKWLFVDGAIVVDEVANSAIDALAYRGQRASEYPSIGDQLDALFHAGVFPADMAAQIQAIKDKYPKV